MPETLKQLGQAKPGAATDADLYTVPASTQTVISSIVVCNTGAATTFRLHSCANAAAAAVGNAIAYDTPIGANETIVFTIGLTIDAADVVRCRSLSGSVAFTASGSEVT